MIARWKEVTLLAHITPPALRLNYTRRYRVWMGSALPRHCFSQQDTIERERETGREMGIEKEREWKAALASQHACSTLIHTHTNTHTSVQWVPGGSLSYCLTSLCLSTCIFLLQSINWLVARKPLIVREWVHVLPESCHNLAPFGSYCLLAGGWTLLVCKVMEHWLSLWRGERF